jgi:hypothetical protein
LLVKVVIKDVLSLLISLLGLVVGDDERPFI